MTPHDLRASAPQTDTCDAAEPWPRPPNPNTSDGTARRIGLEIEFAGLTVAETARLLCERFGATIDVRSRHDLTAIVPRLGKAAIALDTRHAKHLPDDSPIGARLRDVVGDAAGLVVPTEITAPPIAIDDATILDELGTALREAGARGTRAAPTNAFAMQINIEAASTEPGTVLATLRAYLLLEDWLRAEIDVDVTRSVLGFERRFSVDYQRRVLDPAYAPTTEGLIDDYLDANPTRNRGLDLLPILAELDAPRVRAALPAEKIQARPAFHYRLPDCRIDTPGWTPRREWLRWLALERLAADPARLAAAMEDRRDLLGGPLPSMLSSRALTELSVALGRSL